MIVHVNPITDIDLDIEPKYFSTQYLYLIGHNFIIKLCIYYGDNHESTKDIFHVRKISVMYLNPINIYGIPFNTNIDLTRRSRLMLKNIDRKEYDSLSETIKWSLQYYNKKAGDLISFCKRRIEYLDSNFYDFNDFLLNEVKAVHNSGELFNYMYVEDFINKYGDTK